MIHMDKIDNPGVTRREFRQPSLRANLLRKRPDMLTPPHLRSVSRPSLRVTTLRKPR